MAIIIGKIFQLDFFESVIIMSMIKMETLEFEGKQNNEKKQHTPLTHRIHFEIIVNRKNLDD